MNKLEILDEINKIFQEIFNDNQLVITETTTAEDLEEWDSLAHIRIMMTINKTFQLKLSMEEMAELNSIKNIIFLLQEKLA